MAMPHFKISKLLTNTDITTRKLELPSLILEYIPFMKGDHSVDLKAADIWGQEWELHYYTRPTGRKCPVFTTGWHQFVEAKRLQVGDEFIFYGHQVRAAEGELKMLYMIEVKRLISMTFQGEPNIITLDVEYLA